MAIKIRCKCGEMYDDTFKFCPECAEPNPRANKKPKVQVVSSEEENPIPSARKKFTKVGESNLSNATVIETPKPKKKPLSEPEPDYEDEDEEVGYEDEEEIDYEDEDEVDYEDDEVEDYEDDEESDSEDDEYPDYEDEDEDEDEPVVKTPTYKSKGKTLGAPASKSIKQSSSIQTSKPQSKKISSTKTKSSLSKKQKNYDPNFDGYYDDRLPAILDEVTKTSHLDVILKISLAVICIAALIVYCIFYVQV